jgi:hypothetical protein
MDFTEDCPDESGLNADALCVIRIYPSICASGRSNPSLIPGVRIREIRLIRASVLQESQPQGASNAKWASNGR